MAHATRVSLLALTLCILPFLSFGQDRQRSLRGASSSGGTGLADGAACRLDSNLKPAGEACAASPFVCVVTRAPSSKDAFYHGVCNSSYASSPHCTFFSQPYAVGTTGISSNPACHRCDCNNHPENAEIIAQAAASAAETLSAHMAGMGILSVQAQSSLRFSILSTVGINTARCDCQVIGPCFVDWRGRAVNRSGGVLCPERQSRCVIQEVGGGSVDKQGRAIDAGTCEPAGELNTCMAVGKGWGPKYYARGVQGIPDAQDKCKRCRCNDGNRVVGCLQMPNCKSGSGAGWDDDAAAAADAAGAAAVGDVFVDGHTA